LHVEAFIGMSEPMDAEPAMTMAELSTVGLKFSLAITEASMVVPAGVYLAIGIAVIDSRS